MSSKYDLVFFHYFPIYIIFNPKVIYYYWFLKIFFFLLKRSLISLIIPSMALKYSSFFVVNKITLFYVRNENVL